MSRASSQRDNQGQSAKSDSASFGRHGARRAPPGLSLPNMAPPVELVTMQCKMQNAAQQRAILQRKEEAPTPGATATGLPTQLRAGVESLSGISMNDVRVHYNSDKPSQVEALAFTEGKNIYVGPGQEQHLAHEAWHAVQQKQGRVQPTMQMKTGAALNDDRALEVEADVMGARALGQSVTNHGATEQSSAERAGQSRVSSGGRGGVIQRRGSAAFRRMSVGARVAADQLQATIPDKGTAAQIYEANERLMSGTEERCIRTISQDTPHGVAWLHKKGFLTSDEVATYARGGRYLDWQDKSKAQKLQIATYQYWNNIRNTPGHWKGLSVHKRRDAIYSQDADAWEKTLTVPDIGQIGRAHGATSLTSAEVLGQRQQTIDAMAIVRRVFLLLQAGLKHTDTNSQWDNLQEWTAPVAVALSHGGRVNVRIPQVADARNASQFIDWLLGAPDTRAERGVTTRTASTHSAEIGNNVDGDAGTGRFQEVGRGAGYIRGITHFGLNLPVGGLGQLDINGAAILPDGRYGHLYIGYKPPTIEKDGALLIGCENDAHGAPGPNPLGHVHTISAKQGEFSPTGGSKTDKIGAAKGGMKVDLTKMGDNWLTQLQAFETNIQQGQYRTAQLVGQKIQALNLLQ